VGCAADNVIAVSDGKANVVTLADSQYAIADRKAKTMQDRAELQDVQRAGLRRCADGRIVDP